MTLEQVKKYIQNIQNTPIDDIDMNEWKEITKEVLLDYNTKDTMSICNDKTGISLYEHIFLTSLAHKYICKMYDNKIGANFLPPGKAKHSHYSVDNKSINYVLNFLERTQGGFRDIFQVMHENRHAVQFKQFEKEPADILEVDPLSIFILKESFIVRYKPELYNVKNHEAFIMENDANVCAYEYFNKFLENYFPDLKEKALIVKNNYNPEERCDYTSLLDDGADVGDYIFPESKEDTLPVVYEADKLVKQNISKEDLRDYPLLKLIYRDDCTPKSYKEIKEDEENSKILHLNAKPVKRKDSLSEFKEDTTRPSTTHIQKIYQFIINSDPMLYFEDCLNYNRNHKIKELFECTPQLLDVYEKEIRNRTCRYTSIENYEKLKSIFHNLGNENIEKSIDRRVEHIVKSDINNLFGIQIDEYVSDSEEEIKEINVLQDEKIKIHLGLQDKLAKNELDKNKYIEYTKIIDKLYDRYQKHSLETNPKQEVKSNHQSAVIRSDTDEEKVQDKELFEKYSRHLKETYKIQNINESDLDNAFNTITRTKSQHQSQEKIDFDSERRY